MTISYVMEGGTKGVMTKTERCEACDTDVVAK